MGMRKECNLEIQFGLTPGVIVGTQLPVDDYTCLVEGVQVLYSAVGQYTCTLLTRCNIDASKIPEIYGGIILPSASCPPSLGFTKFATSYNANATNFNWQVSFIVLSCLNGTLADVAGAIISVWLSLEIKEECVCC
jgi:hypothetical protein